MAGAVDAEYGGAVVGEEEACEGAWRMLRMACELLVDEVRGGAVVLPGARPANSCEVVSDGFSMMVVLRAYKHSDTC